MQQQVFHVSFYFLYKTAYYGKTSLKFLICQLLVQFRNDQVNIAADIVPAKRFDRDIMTLPVKNRKKAALEKRYFRAAYVILTKYLQCLRLVFLCVCCGLSLYL